MVPEQHGDLLWSPLVDALLAARESPSATDLVVGGNLLTRGTVAVVVIDVRVGWIARVVCHDGFTSRLGPSGALSHASPYSNVCLLGGDGARVTRGPTAPWDTGRPSPIQRPL